ncbi:hypothetical protein EC991_002970 [Linnemannia zychae]|nr:hypothetical protein EC991_002970 [Linnemannia zychae]
MPNRTHMTLRSGKALASATSVSLQSQSHRGSQTLTHVDEEEEEGPLPLSPSFQSSAARLPLTEISSNILIARTTAPTDTWKTLAPNQDVKSKGIKMLDVTGKNQQCARFWRRPEIEALVDWVLIPGNYESLRVENAKKAGRTVIDVYKDAARYVREKVGWTKIDDEVKYNASTARKDVDYIKKKFSETYSRVYNPTGNGTTEKATVSQCVTRECPNFYEMLSIFPTPSMSRPTNRTTAHSTGATAMAQSRILETIDNGQISEDEVDNPRLTPIYAATEESSCSSSNRSSGSISLIQNLSSAVGSLIQVLSSFSGNDAGASSSGYDYFMKRIEKLESKLDQMEQEFERKNELIAKQQDTICELKIKLAHAGASF